MKTHQPVQKTVKAPVAGPEVPEDIGRGFELLGLAGKRLQEYPGARKLAERFVRCSRTKFTQITYSATSR